MWVEIIFQSYYISQQCLPLQLNHYNHEDAREEVERLQTSLQKTCSRGRTAVTANIRRRLPIIRRSDSRFIRHRGKLYV